MTEKTPRDLGKEFDKEADTPESRNAPEITVLDDENVGTEPLQSPTGMVTISADILRNMIKSVVDDTMRNRTPQKEIQNDETTPEPLIDQDALDENGQKVPGKKAMNAPRNTAMHPSPRDVLGEDIARTRIGRTTAGGTAARENRTAARVGRSGVQSVRLVDYDENDAEEEDEAQSTPLVHQEIASLRKDVDSVSKHCEKGGTRKVKPGGSPFVERILADLLPKNFKSLTYEYDATSDPQDHLLRFENGALLHQYSEGAKCKVFLTTLTKSAQTWFSQLSKGYVKSFKDLSTLFLHQFSSARKIAKTSLSLMNFRQKTQETLREYIARLNEADVEVPTATDEVKTIALARGLNGGDLFKSLAKKPPESFDELQQRTDKYINLEEATIVKKEESRGERSSAPKKDSDKKKNAEEKGRAA